MRCNQCDSAYMQTGSMKSPILVHEHGCPNRNKVYDPEDDFWYDEDEQEDEDWDNQCDDLGGTGHGDISYSDADPGL